MGGNKNNISGPSTNGSRLTTEEDTTMRTNNDRIDDNFVTIRINRSHLYGAGCALFGAVLVIAVQRFMGIGIPHPPSPLHPTHPDHQHHHQTTSSSSFSPHPNEQSHPTKNDIDAAHNYAQEASEYKVTAKEGRHPAYIEPEDHPDPDIRRLPTDLSDWPYGAMGLGIDIDHTILTPSEAAKKESMYKSHAFEEYVSELVPLDRSLPDFRGDWCKANYDHLVDSLPPVSVIICFYNEAWSTLLRSVHSVINRTPAHLIREILLVDDSSTYPHLGQKLDDYIKKTWPSKDGTDGKVRVIRQPKRSGLMRSRMVGIKEAAKDTVLLFLDSHIEATDGWVEPLLARIKEDPKVIISPQIDHISDTTFYYKFVPKDLFGLINWNMVFEWHELSQEAVNKKPNLWAPHATPVMAGGLFAIDRKWFETLGLYDEGMEIWGGENIELSLKAWMCGGRIEISPCSHVGHVFRSWSPYDIGQREIYKNNIRVAEVWMDDFKYLYYDRFPNADEPLSKRLGDYGDVKERKELRKNLKCRNFKWFLDHVANGLPYHDLIAAGEIRNPNIDVCIDKNDNMDQMDSAVDVFPCHGEGQYQYWWMNKMGYLLRDYQCVGVSTDDGISVTITDCARSGTWSYDPKKKRLRHNLTGKCLTVATRTENNAFVQRAVVAKCIQAGDEDQEWVIKQYDKKGIPYNKLYANK